MLPRRAVVPGLLLGFGACAHAPVAPPPAPPVPGAIAARLHGHNDYLQPVPLRTALALGLGSVEADIWLAGGELRVGHERWQLRPGRTLRRLYLEPLHEWAATHGGRVRADGAPFVLLVDIKADGDAVWPVLTAELDTFDEMLTRFHAGGVDTRAVTVILSGARPNALVAAAAERRCALDGRLDDLTASPSPPATLVPWISAPWSRVSDWTGADDLLPDERCRIADLVARAHAQGRELRFWGAPDRPEAWRELRTLGVDRIGTDRPAAAVAWWRATP